MKTNRRSFIKIAGVAGAGLITVGKTSGNNEVMPLTGSQKDVRKTASTTEMFLDNQMIEMTPGVSRRLHPAVKHLLNPIIRPDRWWEGNQMFPNATMYDEEEKLFKMWMRCGSDSKSAYVSGHAAYVTYLTSTDGVHWEKPELGVMDFAGRRDHNVVFTGDSSDELAPQGKKGMLLSVIKHPNPRDESEKFVAMAYRMKNRGVYVCTSPDGMHWSCADTPFWKTQLDFASWGDDAQNQMLYDKAKQKWVVYRRIIPEEGERLVGIASDRYLKPVDRYYRVYGYAESEDLREWKNFQPMLSMDADDPSDTELYYFTGYNYGQVYIGYMSVWHLRYPQPIDIQLATSRDGLHWTRVCRGKSFIPSGPLGYYDLMAHGAPQAEPIIVDDTVYIYYCAGNAVHDLPQDPDKGHRSIVALATLKRDRFASLETGHGEPCRLVTKPFTVRHPKLFLNAATWEQGSIRVEALTRDWQRIPGFTEPQAADIQGDALDHPVRWKDNADLAKLSRQEIRLKFYMTRARLHAMTLSDEDRKLGEVDSEYRNDKLGDSAPKLL
jgi:hypothetical protein